MKAQERLLRNYRTAFLRYLPSRDEAALDAGYQIGRSAVTEGLTILDLVQLVLTAGAENLPEDVVVHLGEIEDRQSLGNRGPADLVAGIERSLIPAREVAEERCPVVAVKPFQRLHGRKCGSTPSGAGRLCVPLRYASPSSRSSAV